MREKTRPGVPRVENDKPEPPADEKVNFESLKSLSDLGIDVSFLDHFQSAQEDKMQQGLDKVADKLTELSQLQTERLSVPPTSESAKMVGENETKTAGEVTEKLAELTGSVKPGDVTDSEKMREALGIGMVEDTQTPSGDKVDETLAKSDNEDTSAVNKISETFQPNLTVGESPTENS